MYMQRSTKPIQQYIYIYIVYIVEQQQMKTECMKSARRGKNVKKGLLSYYTMLFANNNIIEFKIFRLHGK